MYIREVVEDYRGFFYLNPSSLGKKVNKVVVVDADSICGKDNDGNVKFSWKNIRIRGNICSMVASDMKYSTSKTDVHFMVSYQGEAIGEVHVSLMVS